MARMDRIKVDIVVCKLVAMKMLIVAKFRDLNLLDGARRTSGEYLA